MNKTCPILKKKWMWTLKQPQPAYKKRKVTPLCIKLLWWKYISVGHDNIQENRFNCIGAPKRLLGFLRSWVYVTSLNDVNFNLSYLDCVNIKYRKTLLTWYSTFTEDHNEENIYLLRHYHPLLDKYKKQIHVYIVICYYHSFKMKKGW